ncbi:MAG: FAD:protein FMN transferase, partial [Candidatus Saccharibacteria bacterium]
GVRRFFIEAGGDIQAQTGQGRRWRVGIRNPFNRKEIVKAVEIADQGVATSGTYIRGRHIYNPLSGNRVDEIVSLTVIGPNIFEADRFATAAFAMGKQGIEFIESLKGLEGYQIDKNGRAKETSGFGQYVIGPETHA